MEISKQWKMLPADVANLKDESPIEYLFMRAMIRAEDDWLNEEYDINPPAEVDDFDDYYYRL